MGTDAAVAGWAGQAVLPVALSGDSPLVLGPSGEAHSWEWYKSLPSLRTARVWPGYLPMFSLPVPGSFLPLQLLAPSSLVFISGKQGRS